MKKFVQQAMISPLAVGISSSGGSGDADELIVQMASGEPFSLKSDAVTKVTGDTFWGMQNLVEIDFPNAKIFNTELGYQSYIQRVSLASVESIGRVTFQGCEDLQYVNIPKVTTIGEYAFARCVSLESIDLPCAESIGEAAFAGCEKLTTVILRTTSTVCVADLTSFNSTPIMSGTGHIYVPSSMYEYYRAGYAEALGGDAYFNAIFRKKEDYPEICG